MKLSVANLGLKDLGIITHYTNLNEVDVSGNYLRCIRALGVMQYLQKINTSSNDIGTFLDICPIPIGLKEVDFSKNSISKILNMKPFWSLTDINLSYNSITEVEGFQNMQYLKSLNLSHNMITRVDLHCPNLIILNLKANCLKKTVEGLDNCFNLCSLNLARNEISELQGLKRFDNLVELHLERNSIVDLYELENLKTFLYLHCLWIHHNQICQLEYSRLMLIHTLPQLLRLDGEKITVEEMKDADNLFDPSVEKLSCVDHTNTLLDAACQPVNTIFDTFSKMTPTPPIILLVGTPKSDCHKLALLLKEKFRHNIYLGGVHSTAATLEGINLDIPITLEAFAQMKNGGEFLSISHILGRICGFSAVQISRAVEKGCLLVATVPLGIALSLRRWKVRPKLVLVLPSRTPEVALERESMQFPDESYGENSNAEEEDSTEEIRLSVRFDLNSKSKTEAETHLPIQEGEPSRSILKPSRFDSIATTTDSNRESWRRSTVTYDNDFDFPPLPEIGDSKARTPKFPSIPDLRNLPHVVPSKKSEEFKAKRKRRVTTPSKKALLDYIIMNNDYSDNNEVKPIQEEVVEDIIEMTEEMIAARRANLLFYRKREKKDIIVPSPEYIMDFPPQDTQTKEKIYWKPRNLNSKKLFSADSHTEKTFFLVIKKNTEKPLSEDVKLQNISVTSCQKFLPENFEIVHEIIPMESFDKELRDFAEQYRILLLKNLSEERRKSSAVDSVVEEEQSEEESVNESSNETLESPQLSTEFLGEDNFENLEDEVDLTGINNQAIEELIEKLRKGGCVNEPEELKNILQRGGVPQCLLDQLTYERALRKERDRAFAAVLGTSNHCLDPSVDDLSPGDSLKNIRDLFYKEKHAKDDKEEAGEDEMQLEAYLNYVKRSNAEECGEGGIYGANYEFEGEEFLQQSLRARCSEANRKNRETVAQKEMIENEEEELGDEAATSLTELETDAADWEFYSEISGENSEEDDGEDRESIPEEILQIDSACRLFQDIEHHKFKHRDALAESIVKTRNLYGQFHQDHPGIFHLVVDTSDLCSSFESLQEMAVESIREYKMKTAAEKSTNELCYGGMNKKDAVCFQKNKLKHYRRCSALWARGLEVTLDNERKCCKNVNACIHLGSEKTVTCPKNILDASAPPSRLSANVPKVMQNPKVAHMKYVKSNKSHFGFL